MSPAAVRDRREHLQALSRQLALRGYETGMGATRTGVPLLIVTNPAQPSLLTENVACITDLDGTPRYVWPWGTHLAEVTELSAAVADVARVLGGDDG